jgi:hypothetical protein
MCGPWALPLALLAGGTVAQYVGNKQAERAQNNRYQDEKRRQDRMTEEQQGLFQDSLARGQDLQSEEGQNKAIDTRQSALMSAIAPRSEGADYLPGSDSASNVVRTATDKAVGTQKAETGNLAAAMARLAAPNDQLLHANIGIARDAGKIGQVASFKAGSADVLNAELRAAAQKGAFLRGIGGLASSIGGMMIPGAAGLGAAGSAAGAAGAAGAGSTMIGVHAVGGGIGGGLSKGLQAALAGAY